MILHSYVLPEGRLLMIFGRSLPIDWTLSRSRPQHSTGSRGSVKQNRAGNMGMAVPSHLPRYFWGEYSNSNWYKATKSETISAGELGNQSGMSVDPRKAAILMIWLVVWNMNFMTFHSVENFMIPTDEVIFFRGVQTTNQWFLTRLC